MIRSAFSGLYYFGIDLLSINRRSVLLTSRMNVHHHKERHDLALFLGMKRSNKHRANRNTHINERKFRQMRARKTAIIELPDDHDPKRDEISPTELRINMMKKGLNPYKDVQARAWSEQQITYTSVPGVMEPTINPENPIPFISDKSAVQESLKKKFEELKLRSMNRIRNYRYGTMRLKKKEGFEKFSPKEFVITAESIYVEAHKALASRDKKMLHKYVTENAFDKMWPDVEKGSVYWELVEFVEPSRVTTIRCLDMPMKSGNDIAQITVRISSLQKVAVFDRFGRLILGSETQARPVLEYVVFENHVASLGGTWRVHDKVHPYWSKPKHPSRITGLLADGPQEGRPLEATELKLGAREIAKEQKDDE